MRSLSTFPCAGAMLGATLDMADAPTGLLIVTGGTQTRIGAHGGLARLAAAIAAAGYPVFRFERRGVGDSGGDDPGFAESGPDLAAAAAAFRVAAPRLRRVVGFGLCDGATALALHHASAGIDALILANPWIVEPMPDLPPPAAIRRRYLDRLASPAAWGRVLTGGIDYRKALRGLAAIGRRPPASPLAQAVATALKAGGRPFELVVATGDATAIAFRDAWRGATLAGLRDCGVARLSEIASRSHSFASGDDPDTLAAICVAALERADRAVRASPISSAAGR